MSKPTIREMVIRAFYGGHSGTDESGRYASLVQIGPIQSFAFFDAGEIVYDAVIDVRDLSFDVMKPETLLGEKVDEEVHRHIDRMKKARMEKTILNNVEQCRSIETDRRGI